MNFWNPDIEIQFFNEAIKNFASPEQVFYQLDNVFYAYIPKGYNAEGKTLQSRNSLIGQFTEKWCKDFLSPIAQSMGLHAVNGIVCDEIGLPNQSNGDLAFCTTNEKHQKAHNIKLIFEIKMSIVNNYKYKNNNTIYAGNYKTHKGTPSILRSDSMLKAIGKSINMRVSGDYAATIPIVILGNTPITSSYIHKVDFLKRAGIIQSFISLYPTIDDTDTLLETQGKGFMTFENYSAIKKYLTHLVHENLNFFSSMISKKALGEIITISSQEKNDIKKAEAFLSIIRKHHEK